PPLPSLIHYQRSSSTVRHVYCKPFSNFLLTIFSLERYSKGSAANCKPCTFYWFTIFAVPKERFMMNGCRKEFSSMQMKDMLFAAMMAAITAVMGLFPGIPLPGGVP